MRRLCIAALSVSLLGGAAPAFAHEAPSLSSVLSHTKAADVALEKAVTNFEERAFKKGKAALQTNRSETRSAVAEAAQLLAESDTTADRREAAQALVAVAKQAGDNERALATVIDEPARGSALQGRIAGAAGTDAGRVETAIVRLQELATTLPVNAQKGIATALENVALERESAGQALTRQLQRSNVGSSAKAAVLQALESDVQGQSLAIDVLEAIRASLPAEAQQGIDAALTKIASSLDRQADRFDNASDNVPDWVAEKLAELAAAARSAADDAQN